MDLYSIALMSVIFFGLVALGLLELFWKTRSEHKVSYAINLKKNRRRV